MKRVGSEAPDIPLRKVKNFADLLGIKIGCTKGIF
jgi:hypothetical protein